MGKKKKNYPFLIICLLHFQSPLEELEEKQNKLSKQLKDIHESIYLLQKDLRNMHATMQMASSQ